MAKQNPQGSSPKTGQSKPKEPNRTSTHPVDFHLPCSRGVFPYRYLQQQGIALFKSDKSPDFLLVLSENIDDSDKEEEDLIGSLSVWQRIFRRNDERCVCVHDHEEKEKKTAPSTHQVWFHFH